ncbi:MAG: hypothetical protein R3B89_09120 [Polyangiaceae bacterium]
MRCITRTSATRAPITTNSPTPIARWRVGALAVFALCLGSGCAASQPPSPKAPPRAIEPRTEYDSPSEVPEHLAPPPAYGNKVVMARAPTATTTY